MADNKEQKQVRRNSFVGSRQSSAKVEFEARMGAIDAGLVAALKSGSQNTVDSIIYSACVLNDETTKELMQSGDAKRVGKTNINKRQLEANSYMLVSGIQLLQTTETGAVTEDGVVNSGWEPLSDAKLLGGEIEIKNGDKVIMPRVSNEIFRTVSGSEYPAGYYKLECPKLIVPLTDIIPTLWLPSASTKKAVKVVFYGVRTNKA